MLPVKPNLPARARYRIAVLSPTLGQAVNSIKLAYPGNADCSQQMAMMGTQSAPGDGLQRKSAPDDGFGHVA